MKKYFFQITGILIIILAFIWLITLSFLGFNLTDWSIIMYIVFAILILSGLFVSRKKMKEDEPLKKYWIILLILIIITIMLLIYFYYDYALYLEGWGRIMGPV